MALQSLTLKSKVDTRIKSNIITLKDIRTRKRFWLKPQSDPTRIDEAGNIYYVDRWGNKIENPNEEQKKPYTNYSYVPLKFCSRWYYWQETYNFLPTPDYWQAIINRVRGKWTNLQRIEQEDPDKEYKERKNRGLKPDHGDYKPLTPSDEIVPLWDSLENEEYYILASGENVMTVILQNRKQLDWIRPDCVVFFGRNTFSPKGLKWQQEKTELEIENYKRNYEGDIPNYISEVGEEAPLMFWVRSWRYVDVKKLYAEIILEKCYVWHYFGNWMNTWFTAKITKSELNNDHINYIGDPIDPDYVPSVLVKNKVQTKHWPTDEDWRVARERKSRDIVRESIPLFHPIFLAIGAREILHGEYEEDEITGEGWIDHGRGELKWEKIPEDMVWDESVAPAHHCPACDACFDFCGDLGDKKAMSSVAGPQIIDDVGEVVGIDEKRWNETPIRANWQPGKGSSTGKVGHRLIHTVMPKQPMKIFTDVVGGISNTTIYDDKGNEILTVPSALKLRFYKKGDKLLDTSANFPALIFLVDADHTPIYPNPEEEWSDWLRDNPARISSNPLRYPRNLRKMCWDYMPKCFYDEPHLLVHSTVQFYFQFKLLFTANCKHLWIRRKHGGFALGYRVLTRSSVAGILYCFESLDIFYRWELKVRGAVQNNTMLNQLMTNVFSNVMTGLGKTLLKAGIQVLTDLGNKALGWLTGGILGGGGGGNAEQTEAIKEIAEAIKKIADGDAANLLPDAKTYGENQGMKIEDNETNKDKEDEEHSKRKASSAKRNEKKTIENSIYYSNTIDYNYDFWEFSNRVVLNPFMVRFEYSGVLYNHLVNNNNACPIQNWDVKGNRFCQIVKRGDFQGQVRLGWDITGRRLFESICARGTTWYDEGTDWDSNGNIQSNWFTPWMPRYKALQSYTLSAVFNTATGQGTEENVYKPGETTIEDKYSFDREKAERGYITYFRIRNSILAELIREKLESTGRWIHSTISKRNPDKDFNNAYCKKNGWGSENGAFCWGCALIRIRDEMVDGKMIVNVPAGKGYWIGFISDSDKTATGPEDEIFLPESLPFAFIIDSVGKIYCELRGEGFWQQSYKMDEVVALQSQHFALRENKEPIWVDRNTATGSGIVSFEADKFPEIRDIEGLAKEKVFDKLEKEPREGGGDVEKDYQTEIEKERQRREQERNERDKQKELERELERERERERDRERLEEKERQRQRELDRQEKERIDRERKDKMERQKREEATREKMKRDIERREKEKREREKK